MTSSATGSVDAIMGGSWLARPVPGRDARTGRLTRDPAPEWDWFYCGGLTPRQERIARKYMKADGVSPDEVATWLGVSVDDAMDAWLQAVETDNAREDDWSDAWEQADAFMATLSGPQELAAHYGVKVATVHQWRHRGRLPEPDYVISGVPLWRGETIAFHQV